MEPTSAAERRRISLRGRSLRRHTGRGVLINTAFVVGINALSLVRGFVVAAFLTQAEYGVWGVVLITLSTVLVLKQAGISDRFVQQDDADERTAFQRAFTMEVLVTGAACVLFAAVVVPLVALVYGETRLLAPGFALVALLPALALQAPLWIYYRRMDFVRQRRLQAIDPVVGFVVTVALAVAGAGYWSLVLGMLAGAWAAAIASVAFAPHPLRLDFDRATARAYFAFSWPIAVGALSAVVISQSTMLAGEATLGLAGAGAIALASGIIQYSDRVDQILTQTLYPGVAAVKDRTELMFEIFVKSNRLALMWGAPFGAALALFAPALVDHVIGERWRSAVVLLQAFGVLTAFNHVGFNWSAFLRARGDTRPLATAALLTTATFCAVTLPLLLAFGLDGLAAGMGAMIAVSLAARFHFLKRIFPTFRPLRHAFRGLVPTVPAAAAVLALRATGATDASAGSAVVELLVFGVLTAAFTLVAERRLLRESFGYLRGNADEAPAGP